MVFELKRMKDIIKKEVEDVLDHKNLNLDVPFMKGKMSSIENLIAEIWKILSKKLLFKHRMKWLKYRSVVNLLALLAVDR